EHLRGRPRTGASLSRGGAAASGRRLHARALSPARRLRRGGRGAGMLPARAETFRHLSRAGDEAMPVRDPAQRLPRRICQARPRHAALGVAGGTGASKMTCDDAEILLHALIDGELDASHAREVEAHIETCPRCAAELAAFRKMRETMTKADLRYTAPASLRQ